MTIMYCRLCDRPVEARRRIGPWTWILGFFSLGVTCLAIPFYRKRCPICESKALNRVAAGDILRLRRRPERRELEERIDRVEEQLDSTTSELDRARTERDFYRDLSDPDGKGGS